MNLFRGFLLGALALNAIVASAQTTNRLAPVPLKDITIDDAFWSPKLKIYRERTIPWSWNYMGWNLRALRKAAGDEVKGDLNGTWDEANLYKFIETAAHSLAQFPNPELERRIDEIVTLLGRLQRPDGFAHAYIINSRKKQWDPTFLDGSHTGYVLGHMIEAAIAYHAATGKRAFLDIAIKAANQAYESFLGPNGRPGFDGHAELEMALVQLHRVTGERRHLQLARALVEWRGREKVPPAGKTPRAYFQDELPVRQQRTLEGHAVRGIFFASGVADLALETDEMDYRLAANRFWDSTTMRRMAITGSIGPRKEHEAFGEDYELPNDGYYESCAACGLVDFAQRMFLLERRAECADVLERALYNAVLHGIALDGTNSYYQNPLTDRNNRRYNSWVCCPPNLSRTLMKVGSYAFASSDRDVYVNLFISGSARVKVREHDVTLRVKTGYPWVGGIVVAIETKTPVHFALHLRKPGWSTNARLLLNERTQQSNEAGYFVVDREWKNGDALSLHLDMPVRQMVAHPNVASCRGKVALQRGPIVFGFEGVDNGGNAQVMLGEAATFTSEHRTNFLGSVTVVQGIDASGTQITALPFFALANREKSSQEVWVEKRGLKLRDDWWLGALYRPE